MSRAETHPKTGNLAVTMATWLYLLDDAGHRPDHAGLRAALDAVHEAGGGEAAEQIGRKLAEAVIADLGGGADFPEVQAWVESLFGADHVSTGFGVDRPTRIRAVRSYAFSSSLPWMACIIDRFSNGVVGPHWVLVERVTDVVTCMDPYPWDDLDEEYDQPLVEFMVKWELAGSQSLRWSA
ncbi:MAG: hypothetical protein VX265_08010 [Myxococcota bacterium]|nr:hypothetical protein [Myxococcota bacterium]MEC8424098.1 hypothetical protein [Myxococcota bacterium]